VGSAGIVGSAVATAVCETSDGETRDAGGATGVPPAAAIPAFDGDATGVSETPPAGVLPPGEASALGEVTAIGEDPEPGEPEGPALSAADATGTGELVDRFGASGVTAATGICAGA
jgi:hypothetical protein